MSSPAVEGLGVVSIRAVDLDHPQPPAASMWDDWGDMDPAAKDMDLQRWIIEVTDDCRSTASPSAACPRMPSGTGPRPAVAR